MRTKIFTEPDLNPKWVKPKHGGSIRKHILETDKLLDEVRHELKVQFNGTTTAMGLTVGNRSHKCPRCTKKHYIYRYDDSLCVDCWIDEIFEKVR